MQKFEILSLGTEPHDMLDARPVVPTSVEQDQLAGCRETHYVALEVSLSFFALRWRSQCDYAAHARVQSLCDALDGAALGGGISALKKDHDLKAFVADPLLQLHQFDLQAAQFLVVIAVFG